MGFRWYAPGGVPGFTATWERRVGLMMTHRFTVLCLGMLLCVVAVLASPPGPPSCIGQEA